MKNIAIAEAESDVEKNLQVKNIRGINCNNNLAGNSHKLAERQC
jgi:hypothetical protein